MALNTDGKEILECKRENFRLLDNGINEQNQGKDLQLCRICFVTGCNLYSMKVDKNLDQAYGILTGLSVENEENMPSYLCTDCSDQLMNCFNFRNRSLRAHLLLLEILRKHDCITLEVIKSLNECQDAKSSNVDIKQDTLDQYNLERIDNIKKETDYTDKEISFKNEPSSEVILAFSDIKKEDEYSLNLHSVNDEDIIDSSSLHEDNLLHEIKAEHDVFDDEGINDGNIESDVYSDASEDDDDSDYNFPMGGQRRKVKSRNVKVKGIKKARTLKGVIQKPGERLLLYDKLCCDICPFKTVSDEKMLHHLATHTSTQRYSNYTSRFIQKVNSNEKRISCNLCKKTYSTKFGLQKHMRTHSGVKPFTCDVCQRGFTEKRDLQSHLRTHSGEKPFGCDLCKRSFSERGNLLRHIRIHSGEKPFSCNFCKKSFNQKHHLKRHMTKHY